MYFLKFVHFRYISSAVLSSVVLGFKWVFGFCIGIVLGFNWVFGTGIPLTGCKKLFSMGNPKGYVLG